jgi:hypothetical protein
MKKLLIGGLAIASMALASPAAAATTVVSPSSMDGWAVQTDNPTAQVNFVNGPATPPLGVGSAQLKTGDGTTGGDGSAQLRNNTYAGTKLSDLTALSYSTYVTTNNGQQAPYIILSVDNTGDGLADDLLFFEPPYQNPVDGNPALPDQGAVALNTWQDWDALAGGWWSTGGFGSPGTGVLPLSDYIAANPNATIVNSSTGAGGVRVLVGFASATDVFDANVDAFRLAVAGGSDTTYDFDPDPANPPSPTDKDQCKNGGWQTFDPPFKNQGQCVSSVVSKRCKKNAAKKKKCNGSQANKKAKKPKKKHKNAAKHGGKHGDRD